MIDASLLQGQSMNVCWAKLTLLCAVLGAPTAQAGPESWTSQGPYGGNVRSVLVNPQTPATLHASGFGGVFRSVNAGNLWNRREQGLPSGIRYQPKLVFSPLQPQVLYASIPFVGLARSDDGGLRWNNAGLTLAAGESSFDIHCNHADSQKVALATSLGVRFSTDGGRTSFVSSTGLPTLSATPPTAVAISPSKIYVGLDPKQTGERDLVYASLDGGNSYGALADLPNGAGRVQEIVLLPALQSRLYVRTTTATYRSDDGGLNWSTLPLLLTGAVLAPIPGNDDGLVAVGRNGLFLSSDAGSSAIAIAAMPTLNGLPVTPTALGLHPNYPTTTQIVIGTEAAGLYRSVDNGAFWTPIDQGFESIPVRALSLPGASGNILFAGHADADAVSQTLFRSVDAGNSWNLAINGLDASQVLGLSTDFTTAIVPSNATLYAVGFKRAFATSNTNGGIYKSNNGGASWNTIDGGLPFNSGSSGPRFIGKVRAIAVDPRSCVNPPPSGPCTTGPLRTFYVTAEGRYDPSNGATAAQRVYKTLDAGANWMAADTGIPQPPVGSDSTNFADPIVVDPTNPNVLYVGMGLRYGFSVATPVVANGVFRSIDGGQSWTHRSNGLPRIGTASTPHMNAQALAIHPNGQTLYVAMALPNGAQSNAMGVFRSDDGGANWFNVSAGLANRDIRALLIDRNDPDTVYAGAFGSKLTSPGGVYKSEDGGVNWASISIGLPADAVLGLALDPSDGETLHAGTNAGVWSLTQPSDDDKDGAPNAIEDDAPNGGDGNADGIPDRFQADVASPLLGVDLTPETERGRENGYTNFIESQTVRGACNQINDASGFDATIHPIDLDGSTTPYVYPLGHISLEIPRCAQLSLRVRFHDADFTPPANWSWRIYGPTIRGDDASIRWYRFPNATRLDAKTWLLQIDASQLGNFRASDEFILFRGGPAFRSDAVFANGFE